ncbi:hypothetical protein [Pandoraea sputorum]|uniref:hypothetical protein n=1 Tax=Pandoraea sputorum TaxID=93222 RepID=UPI00124115B3|nr:hypothetical protein [Pandoraea sputorum]VVE12020.1 hypothetical protein PSP20601_02688 [Pandoraea sputorum]
MGIITTITSLFKSKPQNRQKPLPDTVFDDIDDENREREKWAKYFYEQTKKDAAKYDPALISIRKEYSRQKSYAIRFHFIPREQNNKNVRSYIEYKYKHWQKWQDIRLHYFNKYNHTCQSCKNTFDTKKLNLHELWAFNESEKIQKLIALIPLCEECHSIAHINRHKKDFPKVVALISKYCLYNKVDEDKAYSDFDFAEKERKRRQGIKYNLDMSLLCEFLDTKVLFDCHTDEFNVWLEENFKDNE